MAKRKQGSTIYICSNCSYSQPKWLGRCPECGEWNTLEEHIDTDQSPSFGKKGTVQKARPVPLTAIPLQEGKRFFTGIDEFDRVLGGGAVKRSAVLIGGEPGIGKSTLLIQAASSMNRQIQKENKEISSKGRVLYVSGEESASQIKARAERLGLEMHSIEILCTSRLEDIEDALNAVNPVFVIIDSIQTIYSSEAGIIPGTVNQLKYCSHELISWVKERDSVLFLTAHITKEGSIAGPKSLEHMVDTVILFERNDDDIRFLRANKNRYGSVDELGIFSMSEKGLTPVEDPSSLFIIRRNGPLPAGVAVVPVFEGSRVFLVEIQALTVPSKASLSRVYSDNIDNARVSRIAAVLEKRLGLCFSDQDIYINVAGGVRLTESAIDLALASALYSARTDIPLSEKTALVGEISLAGEVRPVNRIKQRAKASIALGFSKFIAPEKESGITEVTDVKSLIRTLFKK